MINKNSSPKQNINIQSQIIISANMQIVSLNDEKKDIKEDKPVYFNELQLNNKSSYYNQAVHDFLKEAGLMPLTINNIKKYHYPLEANKLTKIGEGNHSKVYALGDSYVVKILKGDLQEILNLANGLEIINSLDNREKVELTLLKNHLLLELPIIRIDRSYMQYVSRRMDGESGDVPRQNFSITKQFLRDLITIVLFLNKNNVVYCNLRPDNILYKKVGDDQYLFYLQDYGSIGQLQSNGDIKGVFYATPLYNLHLSGLVTNPIKTRMLFGYTTAFKIINLSSLVFNIIIFHHYDKDNAPDKQTISRLIDLYQSKQEFNKLWSQLGVMDEKSRDLLYQLRYGASHIMPDQVDKIEDILKDLRRTL